jgi:hypothetical protein
LDRNGGDIMLDDWKDEIAGIGESVDNIKEYL